MNSDSNSQDGKASMADFASKYWKKRQNARKTDSAQGPSSPYSSVMNRNTSALEEEVWTGSDSPGATGRTTMQSGNQTSVSSVAPSWQTQQVLASVAKASVPGSPSMYGQPRTQGAQKPSPRPLNTLTVSVGGDGRRHISTAPHSPGACPPSASTPYPPNNRLTSVKHPPNPQVVSVQHPPTNRVVSAQHPPTNRTPTKGPTSSPFKPNHRSSGPGRTPRSPSLQSEISPKQPPVNSPVESRSPGVPSQSQTQADQCTCNRSQKLILCKTCGGTMSGRLRQPCPTHPGRLFLMDLQCCSHCMSHSVLEVCDATGTDVGSRHD